MRLQQQVLFGGVMLLIARVALAQDRSPEPSTKVKAPVAGEVAAAVPDPDAREGWTRIVPKPLTIDGRLYTPTCSNAPGTTPDFSFFFRQGTADGLVVFFNGGGSCWNDETCSKPRLAGDRANFSDKENQGAAEVYKAQLLPGDGPAKMTGLLDRTDPRNPVRDWSMVFVPYCTGDVHSGSNTAQYKFPGTDKPFSIEHRGWDNMQVILHWMRSEVSPPAHLLVAGSSAGAYGAATHYASLRALFPQGRAVFLGDSGQGVTTPQFEQSRNLNWNYQLPPSVFGPNARNTPDREVVARLAAHFPKDRFGQVTCIRDATQTAFYAQMAPPPEQRSWTNKMLGELTTRQAAPNFRSYVADGATHTILRAPTFFTEKSGGQLFTAWLGALLKDDQLPDNQICPHSDRPQ